MSTLTEIGDLLEANGLGLQGGSTPTIYLGSRPDEPDELIALYQYPGQGPDYVQNSFNPNVEFVSIQVVVRAVDYQAADAKALAAWKVLAPVTNAVLSGTKYRKIKPNSSPFVMGKDSNDRVLIVFNSTVEKEVSLA